MDPRYEQFAAALVRHSIELKKGEHVLIEATDVPREMVIALVRAVRDRKAFPHILLQDSQVTAELYAKAEDEAFAAYNDYALARMEKMDAYVGIRGAHNIFETSSVPGRRMQTVMTKLKPVREHRVRKTRWVVMRWPTPAMAQQARMSTSEFEDLFFRVVLLDYARMVPGQQALKRLMEQTDEVQIKGPGTDLRFSIKGIPAVMCTGKRNLPDGEVFTAPVRDSVEGVLHYNTPTVYQGVSFDNVRFEFEHGRIVNATADGDKRKLKSILDTDDGARHIGEFSLGCNPHVLHPIRDILFDEKIDGSFHFTPGAAYEDTADNGNRSSIHWDIVCIQRKDYGGGEIYFDGKLIRKDGVFVPKSLEKLNREFLLADGV